MEVWTPISSKSVQLTIRSKRRKTSRAGQGAAKRLQNCKEKHDRKDRKNKKRGGEEERVNEGSCSEVGIQISPLA